MIMFSMPKSAELQISPNFKRLVCEIPTIGKWANGYSDVILSVIYAIHCYMCYTILCRGRNIKQMYILA